MPCSDAVNSVMPFSVVCKNRQYTSRVHEANPGMGCLGYTIMSKVENATKLCCRLVAANPYTISPNGRVFDMPCQRRQCAGILGIAATSVGLP